MVYVWLGYSPGNMLCITACILNVLQGIALLLWCNMGETVVWPFGHALGAYVVEVSSFGSARAAVILSLHVALVWMK